MVWSGQAQEIIRRAREEARMKYLEERRRLIENKLEAERAALKAIQDAKVNKTGAIRDEIQGRIRMGACCQFVSNDCISHWM